MAQKNPESPPQQKTKHSSNAGPKNKKPRRSRSKRYTAPDWTPEHVHEVIDGPPDLIDFNA